MKLNEIPRELLILTLAMIIANVAGSMYYPLLPLYLESLGASVQEVGFFFTLEVILAICFRILGGWISDSMGRLPAIALGGIVGMGAITGYTVAPTWEWAIVGALMAAIGSSLVGPSFQAYTAEHAPKDKMSSTFGLIQGLFVICMIIGPLLGGFLVHQFGYKVMMGVATSIFGVATVLRLWMARHSRFEVKQLHLEGLVRDIRGLLALLFAGGLLMWLFIADGLSDAGFQVVFPFLPKYITEIGNLDEEIYTRLFALMSLVSALLMLPGGLFADRFGERWGIALGMGIFSLVWCVIILNPGLPWFVTGFVLAGVGQGFSGPAFSSLISKAVPKKSLGITWGVFMTALGFMAIPAPYIGGYVYDHIAPETPFILAAITSLLAVPLVLQKLRAPAPAPTSESAALSLPAAESAEV